MPIESYARRARVYPVLLAALPGLALAAVMVSWKELGISHLIATTAAGFLLYAFGDLARRLGKKYEEAIYCELGGKPSTTMLRFCDGTFDDTTKAAWLKFLATKVTGKPPTPEREKADLKSADLYYDRCGNWLRENTRDQKKFNLLFEELTTYGYRRNIYGLKWLGLELNLLVVAVATIWIWNRWPIAGDDSVTIRLTYILVIAAHMRYTSYSQ